MSDHSAEYGALQNLRAAVAYVLGRQASDSPCNDEPEALTGDGYLYWKLRHAYEATLIDGSGPISGGTDG